MTRRRVAVLAGGVSPERDVSLVTARAVFENLPADRHEARLVTVNRDGSWSLQNGAPTSPEEAVARLRDWGVDVAFPGLHGRYGEDGTVQGFLALLGIPCVGSGVAASALALDKARTREVVAAHGVPVPPAVEIRASDPGEESGARLFDLGLPVAVKDPTGGSSLDLYRCATAPERDAVIETLLADGRPRVLVERWILGEEVTVPVVGNTSRGGSARTLPPILIRPKGAEWFDYRTKYDADAVDEICPAPIEEESRIRVEELALRVHGLLGCDGLTRTDFILPEAGEPRFLEINTLPGLTPVSLCPKAAAAAGIPFGELLAELVELALRAAHIRGRPLK